MYTVTFVTTKNFDRALDMIRVYVQHFEKRFPEVAAYPTAGLVKVKVGKLDDVHYLVNDLTYPPRYVRAAVTECDGTCEHGCTPCDNGGIDYVNE